MTIGVQCWPEGHATRCPCENEIPDTDNATMNRFGWGFVYARDDGSTTGEGAFYACPEHRSDCTEEEREVARERYALATGGGDGRCPKCGGTHPDRHEGACAGPPTPSAPPPHRMQG
jgi:hypothetical protein